MENTQKTTIIIQDQEDFVLVSPNVSLSSLKFNEEKNKLFKSNMNTIEWSYSGNSKVVYGNNANTLLIVIIYTLLSTLRFNVCIALF